MKVYNDRMEYEKDVDLIKNTILDLETRSKHIDELFYQWKNTSPDSPWYENREIMESKEKKAVETLIKISEEYISSEWCGEHTIFEEI